MMTNKNIVILAAGSFPTHAVPLGLLLDADFVVCCDSAYRSYYDFSPGQDTPFVVVGDGDSLSPEWQSRLGERFVKVEEQDYNDLHKAMVWAVSHFDVASSTFTILGAMGRREDHAIGNISYLADFVAGFHTDDIAIVDDYGRWTAFTGSRSFVSFPRQQVSIFTLTPHLPISASGLQYPLDNAVLTRWWNATLNSAVADSFSLRSDGWLIVFQSFEPKE